jgi:hypothetical protein
MTWSMLDCLELAQLARIVSGEPMSPPDSARSAVSGLAAFHAVYSSPHVDLARVGAPGRAVVVAQAELEERGPVGLGPGLLVGSAHMNMLTRRCWG